MPRVLRIINRLNLGGPTFNAALLTKHMSPKYETLLVAGTKQDSEESSDFIVKDLGIDFRKIAHMKREINPIADYKAYQELRSIIKEYKPDIVHTHAAKSGALGRLAAIHSKVPVILHTFHGHVFHSYFNSTTTKVFLKIERYLANKSSAIIAISQRQREELVKDFKICDASKMHVIPLGFNLDRFIDNQIVNRKKFRVKYELADDEIAVTIIGRLVPVKNHAMFLRMVKSMQDQKNVRFFIVGDGESKKTLLELASSLGIDYTYFPDQPRRAQLTFCSWMKDAEVAVAGSDLITLTSYNEGTPVSLIEAQAGGKAIISTNVGGIENVVKINGTALLCEPDDDQLYLKHMLNLTTNDSQRINFGANGLNHVRDRYHYTRLVHDMMQLYGQLLH